MCIRDSIVPEPTEANVRRKSKTRAYIGTLHRKLAPRDADEANALDNCPAHLGGNRPADPADMSGFFEPVQNPDALPGTNVIHFKGSYIGGDNFVVQARLSLDGVDGAGAIKADHRELSG